MLQQLVLGQIRHRRPEVVVPARIGEDAAAIRFGPATPGELCVVTSDPITGASTDIGWLGVHVCCNDVGAMGAEPIGIQVVLLLPPATPEGWLQETIQRVQVACDSLNIDVLGGHTEVTDRVTEPVFIGTALGRVTSQQLVTTAGARPGDGLVVTKGIGLEGTAILAREASADLEGKVRAELLQAAQQFWNEISVVPEGRLAAGAGATAMHDVTEGGLYVAARELAAASGCCFRIWRDRLPIRPATAAICEALGLDPLGLVSSGCLLIAHPEPGRLVEQLTQAGIPAAHVGELLPDLADSPAPAEGGEGPCNAAVNALTLGEGQAGNAGAPALGVRKAQAGRGELILPDGRAVAWPVREEDELWRYWSSFRRV